MSFLTPRSQKLGRNLAAHLLRRTTFGPSRSEITRFANQTPAEAVSALIKRGSPAPPKDTKTGQPWLPKRTNNNSPESSLRRFTICWWLNHMCRSELSLNERMVFFYHTHFTTIQSRANYGSALYYQNALFRNFALGNFKKLATKICLDNAMLMHLDGRFNRKESPNENFAREFLELYTIGKGPQRSPGDYTHFTEQDVKEAARVFSGFLNDESFTRNIDPETKIPMGIMTKTEKGEPTRHDFGTKTFSDKFGGKSITPVATTQQAVQQEISALVDMIFAQRETARHICRKLYRFFVYHQITSEIEQHVIEPLADIFIRNRFEVRPVLETLLRSQHFYDMNVPNERKIVGTLVKSPLEIVSGIIRYFAVTLPSEMNLEEFYNLYADILYRMELQDMYLYEPPDVAGYAAYNQTPDYNRNWISASTLAQRYKFPADLVSGIRRRGYSNEIKLDVVKYVENRANISDPGNANVLVRELIEDIFPVSVSPERFAYFLNEVLLDNLSLENWAMEWKIYRSTQNDRGVRRQLERLFVKLMQSPEYQLF